MNIHQPYVPKKSTICWDCKNAVGGCSWSKTFTPVEGWQATPTIVRYLHDNRYGHSYIVEQCPEFIEG